MDTCQRSRVSKYTFEIFISRARKVHGEKYDYSQIKEEDVRNNRSHVPIKCNACGHLWNPMIANHIDKETGCPFCAGSFSHTLTTFLLRAREIHGEKYDYSQVKEEDIKCNKSHVPLRCNFCGHSWNPSISSHINLKTGCPLCAGKLRYTLTRFLSKAREIHGEKYNYSFIREEDIRGKESHVPLRCNLCRYSWNPTVGDHINGKYGCPCCAGQLHYTLALFLSRAKEIHGEKYDYSQITEDDIKNARSHVPLKCNCCGYSWNPTIFGHINNGNGCPKCSKKLQYTLSQFLSKAKEIHGEKYDYSQITEDDIKNNKSRVPLKCNCCAHSWSPKIADHINSESGCPKCIFSKGELECERVLKTLSCKFITQFELESLKKKRYDFMFEHENKKYILEYDGEQHFEFTPYFHKTKEDFQKRKDYDILKTRTAVLSGFRIIRLACSVDEVEEHIITAINIKKDYDCYLSSIDKYEFIIKELKLVLVKV